MNKEKGQGQATARESPDACISSLIARNRAWAERKILRDPRFFSRLVAQQRPKYFWIGCSDSRVPATEIVDLDPGEMFVHRNVANLAIASDPNFAASLRFAVDVLQVQHIIVVGHHGCGGISAAMGPDSDDEVGRWLEPVRSLHRSFPDPEGHLTRNADLLCERNVAAQVHGLARNPIIQSAWERGAELKLHGMIYALHDGHLQSVCHPVSSASTPFARGQV